TTRPKVQHYLTGQADREAGTAKLHSEPSLPTNRFAATASRRGSFRSLANGQEDREIGDLARSDLLLNRVRR
ncbi:MAG: hypothetical protein ACP5JJ_11105, partial [Anaerolineae bacterium]